MGVAIVGVGHCCGPRGVNGCLPYSPRIPDTSLDGYVEDETVYLIARSNYGLLDCLAHVKLPLTPMQQK